MKGLIFTEFLEMVESKWGLSTVDSIIGNAGLPNKGSYTAVGTYPHGEMVRLVVALHEQIHVPVPELLKVFGECLFDSLSKNYGYMMAGESDSLTLLQNIEDVIHVEVKKLYPESNPPMFDGERLDHHTLRLHYKSHRSMADVAEGLILGCGKFYKDELSIERIGSNKDGTEVSFLIRRINNE